MDPATCAPVRATHCGHRHVGASTMLRPPTAPFSLTLLRMLWMLVRPRGIDATLAGTCHAPLTVPNASTMCAGAVNYSFFVPAGFTAGLIRRSSCSLLQLSPRTRRRVTASVGVDRPPPPTPVLRTTQTTWTSSRPGTRSFRAMLALHCCRRRARLLSNGSRARGPTLRATRATKTGHAIPLPARAARSATT